MTPRKTLRGTGPPTSKSMVSRVTTRVLFSCRLSVSFFTCNCSFQSFQKPLLLPFRSLHFPAGKNPVPAAPIIKPASRARGYTLPVKRGKRTGALHWAPPARVVINQYPVVAPRKAPAMRSNCFPEPAVRTPRILLSSAGWWEKYHRLPPPSPRVSSRGPGS